MLITNDDGIDCEGLVALAKALQALRSYEIFILAPDGNRSGVSNSISLYNPVRIVKHGKNSWSCSGTPADCAMIATLGALPFKPDIIVSGINAGPNIGTDLIYSGTAAAARQAALHGIPSIAFSLAAHTAPFYWEQTARFIAENLETFLDAWEPDIFINVNIPNREEGPLGIRDSFPSRRVYNDSVVVFNAPDGHQYCFLDGGAGVETKAEEGSDWHAIQNGYVSLCPVYIHPVVQQSRKYALSDPAAGAFDALSRSINVR